MDSPPPIELLNHAAERLGAMHKDVVFLGGAVVGLMLTEKGTRPPRVTRDVDVAIEIGASILDLHELDRRLLSLGFRNDIHGPTCRYLSGFLVVDVIPVSSGTRDQVNPWYPRAIATSWCHVLDNGRTINVIDPVCFLATKLAAFRSPTREHRGDVLLSRDFADIVRVIDGRPAIVSEVASASADLREFLQAEFAELLQANYLNEALEGQVEPGREARTIELLKELSRLQ